MDHHRIIDHVPALRRYARVLTGDAWAEDPGCYLRDDEIGLACGSDAQRVAVTPFTHQRQTIEIHPESHHA